jgi:hypothetical protein
MGLSKEHKSNNCYDFLSIKYTILKGKYKWVIYSKLILFIEMQGLEPTVGVC